MPEARGDSGGNIRAFTNLKGRPADLLTFRKFGGHRDGWPLESFPLAASSACKNFPATHSAYPSHAVTVSQPHRFSLPPSLPLSIFRVFVSCIPPINVHQPPSALTRSDVDCMFSVIQGSRGIRAHKKPHLGRLE